MEPIECSDSENDNDCEIVFCSLNEARKRCYEHPDDDVIRLLDKLIAAGVGFPKSFAGFQKCSVRVNPKASFELIAKTWNECVKSCFTKFAVEHLIPDGASDDTSINIAAAAGTSGMSQLCPGPSSANGFPGWPEPEAMDPSTTRQSASGPSSSSSGFRRAVKEEEVLDDDCVMVYSSISHSDPGKQQNPQNSNESTPAIIRSMIERGQQKRKASEQSSFQLHPTDEDSDSDEMIDDILPEVIDISEESDCDSTLSQSQESDSKNTEHSCKKKKPMSDAEYKRFLKNWKKEQKIAEVNLLKKLNQRINAVLRSKASKSKKNKKESQ